MLHGQRMRPFFRDLIDKRGGIFPQDALELPARRMDGRGDKKVIVAVQPDSDPLSSRVSSYLVSDPLYGNIIVYHDTYNISMMVKL